MFSGVESFMDKLGYYRFLFLVGAIWNIVLGIGYIFTSLFIEGSFEMFGVEEPPSLIFYHLFFGIVIIYGVGYYLVSTNLDKNHGIVLMGILGKLWVFCISCYYFLVGDFNFFGVTPSIGDLFFSILFVEFLLSYKKL